jgi:hypothetical protein
MIASLAYANRPDEMMTFVLVDDKGSIASWPTLGEPNPATRTRKSGNDLTSIRHARCRGSRDDGMTCVVGGA